MKVMIVLIYDFVVEGMLPTVDVYIVVHTVGHIVVHTVVHTVVYKNTPHNTKIVFSLFFSHI